MDSYPFYGLLLMLLTFYVFKATLYYHRLRPRSVAIIGSSTILGRCLTEFRFLVAAPQLLKEAHTKTAGKPFAIPRWSNYYVCISDTSQIREINGAPGSQLSLHESLNEILFPEYNLHRPKFHPFDYTDKANSRAMPIAIRTLQIGLRPKLSSVGPGLQQILNSAMDNEMHDKKADNNGWIAIPATPVISRLVGRLNCFVILGQRISSDPLNVEAASRFTRGTGITARLLAMMPSVLHRVIAFLVKGRDGAYDKLERSVTQIVEERLSKFDGLAGNREEPLDCIQWVINALQGSPRMSSKNVANETLCLLFAGAFQTPRIVVFALYNLCKHQEYLERLRDEVARMTEDEICGSRDQDTPLLDSFLKETARLFPDQAIVMPRKVLSAFTFNDGTYVPAGNKVCVAQQAMMSDPAYYDNPSSFQGFRFANADGDIPTSTSRLSHPSTDFTLWGSVRYPCPGRFYVSMITKMIMAHLITTYDIKLANEDINPSVSLGATVLTHPGLLLRMRERKQRNVMIK